MPSPLSVSACACIRWQVKPKRLYWWLKLERKLYSAWLQLSWLRYARSLSLSTLQSSSHSPPPWFFPSNIPFYAVLIYVSGLLIVYGNMTVVPPLSPLPACGLRHVVLHCRTRFWNSRTCMIVSIELFLMQGAVLNVQMCRANYTAFGNRMTSKQTCYNSH